MKLTPFQLAIIAVGGFASIIMLNLLTKYQANDDFREQLSNLSPSDLFSIRTRRMAEERMEPVAAAVSSESDTEDTSEENEDV